MKFKMFLLNDAADKNDLDLLLKEIQFDLDGKCNKMINKANSEQYYYNLMKEVLSSDCIAVDAYNGLTFIDGSIFMLAKLYKIPIFVYNNIKKENTNQKIFCEELYTKFFANSFEFVSYLNEVYKNGKLQVIHNRINPDDVFLKLQAFDAGYDLGYSETQNFWGNKPASYVQMVANFLKDHNNITCVDLGCGTGKNAIFLDSQGFSVEAMDSSYYAIIQAKSLSSKVVWKTRDVRKWNPMEKFFDIIVMTGLLHCFSTEEEIIQTIKTAKEATREKGYNVISVFNDNVQDLSGHPADFKPVLLPHVFYMDLYKDWNIIASSDTILDDEHPNNNIKHRHSITRILAQKP